MEFKPFDKVLVRFSSNDTWNVNFFGYKDKNNKDFPYFCCGDSFKECIPFIDNEHLLGTINPYTPNWKPEVKELVLVTRGNEVWFPAFFASYRDDSLYPYSVFTYVNSNGFVGGITDVCDIKPFKQEDM